MAEYDRAIALDPAMRAPITGAASRTASMAPPSARLPTSNVPGSWSRCGSHRAPPLAISFLRPPLPEAIAELSATLEFDEAPVIARTYRAGLSTFGSARAGIGQFLKLREREARTPGSFGDVGQALAMLGRADEARAELARLMQLATTRYVPALDIATIHASLGDRDSAFNGWNALCRPAPTNISLLEYDPSFDACTTMHATPRWWNGSTCASARTCDVIRPTRYQLRA